MKAIFLVLLVTTQLSWGQKIENPTVSYSGGSIGTGGDDKVKFVIDEMTIKESLQRIKSFFVDNKDREEILNDFPEVNVEDLSHKIEQVLNTPGGLKFFYDKQVFDFIGAARFAVNYESLSEVHYDMEKMRSLHQSPDVFYVIQFHEILGLLGLEKNNPNNELEIENYPIAHKLAKYVVEVLGYGLSLKTKDKNACTLKFPYFYNINNYDIYDQYSLDPGTHKRRLNEINKISSFRKKLSQGPIFTDSDEIINFKKIRKEIKETAERLIKKGYVLIRPIYEEDMYVDSHLKGSFNYARQSEGNIVLIGNDNNTRYHLELTTNELLTYRYKDFATPNVLLNMSSVELVNEITETRYQIEENFEAGLSYFYTPWVTSSFFRFKKVRDKAKKENKMSDLDEKGTTQAHPVEKKDLNGYKIKRAEEIHIFQREKIDYLPLKDVQMLREIGSCGSVR